MKTLYNLKLRRNSISVLLTLVLLIVVIPLYASEITKAGYINVTATEARHILNTKQNVLILDVRDQQEYESGHLTGALSVPLAELQQRMHTIDFKMTLLVYSQKKEQSAAACELLWNNGYRSLFNLSKGITEWKQAGFYMITGNKPNGDTKRQIPPGTGLPKNRLSATGSGYCPSYGGSHTYEYIQSATYSLLSEGILSITVIVGIANPTGCVYGEPCPEYDDSPEYINAWIDWNGNQVFEENERALNAALTGYLGINYYGSMSTSSIISIPDTIVNSTWMRVNLGWDYDPDDPCDYSWTWGDVVDQPVEINVTPPKIEDITIKGIPYESAPITNDPSLNGAEKVKLEAKIKENENYDITKINWSDEIVPGNDNPYEYTASPGSQGNKNVTCTITYKHKTSGIIGTDYMSKTFKLFFNKSGDDDGNHEPNWFKYWKSDGAVPDMEPAKYDAAEAGYGYMTGTGELFLSPTAAGQHYSSPIVLTTSLGTESFGGPTVKGIDCTAEIIGHENYHNWVTNQWKAGGSFAGKTDSDKGTQAADCNDELPDFYETATSKTKNDDTDSYDLEHKKSDTYKIYGDQEYMAMRAGDNKRGIAAKDWAYQGKQSNPSYHFEGGEKASPLAYEPVMAKFTGNFSDIGVDTTSDGIFEYLQIMTGVNVTAGGQFNIVARLYDNSLQEITFFNKPFILDIGIQNIPIEFEGLAIQQHGIDGPYEVSVLMYNEFGDEIDNKLLAFTTNPYNHNAFKKKDATFSTNFSDYGTDTDYDYYYDYLTIEAGINVLSAGAYAIEGALYGSDGNMIEIINSDTTLSEGNNTVALKFDGSLINQSKINGPYQLRYLSLSNKYGTVDFVLDAFSTKYYSYQDFKRTQAQFNNQFSDFGTDLDNDGRYNFMTVKVGVESILSGTYKLVGHLYDKNDEKVLTDENTSYLYNGSNTMDLEFDGISLYQHGVDGPYILKYLSLLDENGNLMDLINNADSTSDYLVTDFQKPASPLVTLTGNYVDYKSDLDSNDVYEYLTVDAGVTLSDSGYVIIKAKLEDMNGAEIVWAENIAYLHADIPQVVLLNFDGRAIFKHKVNGPYYLKNVYIYHTGDPSQPDYVANAYTTSSYLYTEFDTVSGNQTSISGNESGGFIKLYPNPSNGRLAVEIQNTKGPIGIQLITETGKMLLTKQYEPHNSKVTEYINLAGYPSGTYFIKVVFGKTVRYEKLILKK
ncbi:MAG: rhodanese-like domain-containing protein [Lentimicrobiaceae bacterium]|jgi:rhodanese-related sulfurtransferase